MFLGGNNIQDVPLDVIEEMTALEYLHLGENAVQSLINLTHPTKAILPNIDDVHLWGNQISHVQEDLLCNKSVVALRLGSNLLTVISPLRCCDTLTNLYIGNNMLLSFNGTFFCPELTYIQLQNNLLSTFPDFSRNPKLYHINFNGNQLSAVDPSFIPTLVTELNMKANNFITFPNLADQKARIVTLDLSENNMGDPAENVLEGYTSLKYLYLNNIGMTKLFKVCLAGSTLETLEMKDNHISYLDVSMMPGMVVLRVLNLKNNFLTSVPFGLLSTFPLLEEMNLKENKIAKLGHFDDTSSTYQVCIFYIIFLFVVKVQSYQSRCLSHWPPKNPACTITTCS